MPLHKDRKIYALTSLLTFILSATILLYILLNIGLFSKNKIVVATLATTGPDFEVVFGQIKLKMQMPDTIENTDVSGVMLTDKSLADFDDYLNKNNGYMNNDYYVLTTKVVGAEQSDSAPFHPLIEASEWRHINRIFFWTFIIIDIGLFLLFRLFYKKYKNAVTKDKEQ